jgi:hypothetical protein
MSAGTAGSAQAIARDYQNREFTTSVALSVKALADFVERFEASAKAKLSEVSDRLSRLERLLDSLEQQRAPAANSEAVLEEAAREHSQANNQ